MAEFESDTNKDCQKCCFCRYFDDGGGDYKDMVFHCDKVDKRVTFTRDDDKPCKLPKGKYYIKKVSVSK